MEKSLRLRTLAIALAIISIPLFSFAAQAQEKVAGSGEVRVPKLQSEAEFQKLMPITGEVETYFGDFQLDHSYPTMESADRIYELMDHQRASQLYLWGLPLVAMERLHQNYWENFDYAYNTFIKIETFNERRGYLTANETTNYALGHFNTRGGAVILDLPPGKIVGLFVDMWQQGPSDVGVYGPNAGRGGRHVILGPNTPRDAVPEPRDNTDDFKVHRIGTDRGTVLLRVVGSPEVVDATWQKVRLFNYGEESAIRILDGGDKFAPTYQPRGLAYWKLLHAAINNEVVEERDRLFMYWLKTLGIEKDKPFNPTVYQIKVLEDGAKTGEMMARNLVFNERLEGVLRQNKWRYVLGGQWGDALKSDQRMKYYDIFDPRARYTYEAQTTSPAMTIPRPGIAQGYLGKFGDEKDGILRGEDMYVIRVEGPVPADLFWSITIYDPDTRALLDNRAGAVGGDVTVDSIDPDTRVNEDGSIYILLGPDGPPKGWEANYVQTLPDRGWFPYFRAYGARAEFFDDSYKLPTITNVKSFSKFMK
jgi:hypothetical protein